MKLDVIEAFLAVAEAGTMGDAAQVLRCTPPAVSQKIARLESDFGVQVFRRHSSGVTLTDVGELLYGRSQTLIGQLVDMRAEVLDFADQQARTVRLSSFSSANVNVLPLALRKFREAKPSAAVALSEVDYFEPYVGLRKGDVELVISFVYSDCPIPVPPGIVISELAFEPLVAVLPSSHRLAENEAVALREMTSESWVFFPVGNVARISVESEAARQGLELAVNYETRDYQVIHQLVGAGLGVALLPKMMAAEFGSATVSRPLHETKLGRQIVVARRETSESSTVEALSTAIFDAFCEKFPDIAGEHVE